MSQQKSTLGSLPNWDYPIRKGLKLDLPMLGVGDLNDYSLNGNHGTNNGATWTAGQYGPVLRFGGSSDYVRVPDSDAFSFVGDSPFTFIIKINLDNVTNRQALISKYSSLSPFNGEYAFSFRQTENALGCQLVGPTEDDWIIGKSTTLGDISGAWHTVAVTYNGNKLRSGLKFYLDGNDVSSGTGITAGTYTGMSNLAAPLDIGGALVDASGFESWLDGDAEYVNIFNKELTARQVAKVTFDPWEPYRDNSNIILWAAAQAAPVTGGVNLITGLLQQPSRLIA
jgi:hypothetical protein